MNGKKITLILVAFAAVVLMAGYLIGDYFVGYAVTRGNDSDPTAPPAACAKIANPSLVAPAIPKAKSEEWQIKSADNLNLVATCFYADAPTHRWAILVHGYGRDQSFARDYAEHYLKRGYNVVTPDLRAAGKSEGKYLTMGAAESGDIVCWAEKIVAVDPKAQTVLHGVSMGAATVMMAAALNPPNTVATVEDCGYTSAYAMFTAQLNRLFGLPQYPVMPCVDAMCRIKTGFFLSDATPIESVGKATMPMLFIHGDADKLVPYSMMGELYEKSAATEKAKITVAGAGHADCKSSDPEGYFNAVFDFVEKFMKNE